MSVLRYASLYIARHEKLYRIIGVEHSRVIIIYRFIAQSKVTLYYYHREDFMWRACYFSCYFTPKYSITRVESLGAYCNYRVRRWYGPVLTHVVLNVLPYFHEKCGRIEGGHKFTFHVGKYLSIVYLVMEAVLIHELFGDNSDGDADPLWVRHVGV